MRIELEDPRPPAPTAEVEAVVAELKGLPYPLRMPSSYREFLEEQDGGRPVRCLVDFQQYGRPQTGVIDEFFGVHASHTGGTLAFQSILGGRVPAEVFPVADTANGDAICVGSDDDRVWYWDHEAEAEPADYSNMTLLADSFGDFLEMLYPDDAPPPVPNAKPRRGGWRRVFRLG